MLSLFSRILKEVNVTFHPTRELVGYNRLTEQMACESLWRNIDVSLVDSLGMRGMSENYRGITNVGIIPQLVVKYCGIPYGVIDSR